MQLWNRRSYQTVLQAEQDRLLYIARLKQRHGVWWRFKAPAEARLPFRLASLGVPLPPSGSTLKPDASPPSAPQLSRHVPQPPSRVPAMASSEPRVTVRPSEAQAARHTTDSAEVTATSALLTDRAAQPLPGGETLAKTKDAEATDSASVSLALEVDGVISVLPKPEAEGEPRVDPEPASKSEPAPEPEVLRSSGIVAGTGATRAEAIYAVFAGLTDQAGKYPSMPVLSKVLFQEHGITGRKGRPMSAESLRRYRTEWMSRYEGETAGVAS